VFRSRSIKGPYEVRIVMDQGKSPINGPHQGAWVQAHDGSDWFLHFQDKGVYGRVVHLQPMRWVDGWPIIGEDGPTPGTGQPVLTYKKPVAGGPVKTPPTSDEFNGPKLGLQWQWNANSQPNWYSLTEKPGSLRLRTVAAPEATNDLRTAPSLLTQKLPAPEFVVNTRVQLNGAQDGDRAGLVVNALQYAWIALRKTGNATQLVYTTCAPAKKCKEASTVVLESAPSALYLRMSMGDGGIARFSYSTDNTRFVPVGEPFTVTKGHWVGAQVGLFSVGTKASSSSLDVDYFRVTAP
jgi:beta-xylosidase